MTASRVVEAFNGVENTAVAEPDPNNHDLRTYSTIASSINTT